MKKAFVILHDLVATIVAVVAALAFRFSGAELDGRIWAILPYLPVWVAIAGLVYWWAGLYQSRWRFASILDLWGIAKAVSVLTAILLVIDYALVSQNLVGSYYLGKTTLVLYWIVQCFALGAPRALLRLNRMHKVLKENVGSGRPSLIIGRSKDADVVLRSMEAGLLKGFRPVGVLSPLKAEVGESVRGVRVVGTMDALDKALADLTAKGLTVTRILAAGDVLSPGDDALHLFASARRLGLPILRAQQIGGVAGARTALEQPQIEDLLIRPTVGIDYDRLERLVQGRRVLVTGGGGSIGGELALRCLAFGAGELTIVDQSELALHHIEDALEKENGGKTAIRLFVADIRDRPRIFSICAEARPEIVFHAAALKHVPFVEENWTEGVKTNVFGSVNVIDAALAAGASTIVNISTDKAIRPVSVLGATKRFAEIYTQVSNTQAAGGGQTRLASVRFGNVLGSSGSVVPKFQEQIARGGPVTITHPDVVRYFMTVREAAELVLSAASHANAADSGVERPSVYVLKMGQQVRILDLARKMIEIAGFTPDEDIPIVFTGMRPGERIHEILFEDEEPVTDTGIAGVMSARTPPREPAAVQRWLRKLETAVAEGNRHKAEALLRDAIPTFAPGGNVIPLPTRASAG